MIVADQTFQFWPVRGSRVVPGGMEKVLVDAVLMREAETAGSEVPEPEPEAPELDPEPEPEPPVPEAGGTVGVPEDILLLG